MSDDDINGSFIGTGIIMFWIITLLAAVWYGNVLGREAMFRDFFERCDIYKKAEEKP